MFDRILLIDKPANMTSFGVVARIRRVLSNEAGKKVKVGHTGTLDPFATGLMIVVTGKECKNAGTYSKLDKSYDATIVLGHTSTTGDPEGEIAHISAAEPTRAEVNAAIEQFVGEIQQRPPIYSAIKIDGVRAYKLARDGKEVEIPLRSVTIYSLEVVRYEYPELVVRAHVSSGTYIRTLAQDIGVQLGTGAYTKELRRLTVGTYTIDNALTLNSFGITD